MAVMPKFVPIEVTPGATTPPLVTEVSFRRQKPVEKPARAARPVSSQKPQDAAADEKKES